MPSRRLTYLAVEKENAVYGKGDGSGEWAVPEVLLEVKYNPLEHKDKNNYIEGCWQVRVYEPILLKNIKKIV